MGLGRRGAGDAGGDHDETFEMGVGRGLKDVQGVENASKSFATCVDWS